MPSLYWNTYLYLKWYRWKIVHMALNNNYPLTLQPFDFERTWWRLFQKRVVCIKFDIYGFFYNTKYLHLWDLVNLLNNTDVGEHCLQLNIVNIHFGNSSISLHKHHVLYLTRNGGKKFFNYSINIYLYLYCYIYTSWSYCSWIYNYLCNQCLTQLKLWVRTLFMARCIWYNIMW